MRQQLAEGNDVLRRLENVAIFIFGGGDDIGSFKFREQAGDVFVEGYKALFYLLEGADRSQQFGAGGNPEGVFGGDGSGIRSDTSGTVGFEVEHISFILLDATSGDLLRMK